MPKPRVLVLTGFGINCDHETKFAFDLAGGAAERVHVNDLIDTPARLAEYQILAFPGGFSFGDDIAAGRVLANKFMTHLREPMERFLEADKLVIGICNGFQVMVKGGLITAADTPLGPQTVTLAHNTSGRYEDRWVHLKTEPDSPCVFTRGLSTLYFPVAHGEGKFYAPETTLDRIESRKQVVLRYVTAEGEPAQGRFPVNPNGSPRDIAGVCDPTGRIFGLMPHPERVLTFVNHPRYHALAEQARREGRPVSERGDGFAIFENGVRYFTGAERSPS